MTLSLKKQGRFRTREPTCTEPPPMRQFLKYPEQVTCLVPFLRHSPSENGHLVAGKPMGIRDGEDDDGSTAY